MKKWLILVILIPLFLTGCATKTQQQKNDADEWVWLDHA